MKGFRTPSWFRTKARRKEKQAKAHGSKHDPHKPKKGR